MPTVPSVVKKLWCSPTKNPVHEQQPATSSQNPGPTRRPRRHSFGELQNSPLVNFLRDNEKLATQKSGALSSSNDLKLSNVNSPAQSPYLASTLELDALEQSITRLLDRIGNCENSDIPKTKHEECLICVSYRASIQTFPCGHIVQCRTCFLKSVQLAVKERKLPLRCILCRTRVSNLKQQRHRTVTFRSAPATPGTYALRPSSLWH